MEIIKKPKLLLHSCCAPCSTSVIERLAREYDVTVYFYNPNIAPAAEYERRKNEQAELLKKINIDLVCGDYDNEKYLEYQKDFRSMREGEQKCYRCYEFRIAKAYEVAKQLGFTFYTTTLSVSPHKNAKWINEIGAKYSDEQTCFLESDFKKKDGFKRSLELSKEFGLYRQNYCGCTPVDTEE